MQASIRLLVVEDSADDYQLVLRVLARGDLRPSATRVDSMPAVQEALDQPWDAIVCDYRLPGFTALEVLSLVKERGLDLPFLIVSGAIGEETAVEAMRAGAHDYIMKGNLSRLPPAIDRELREAEERRSRRQAEAALRRSEELFRDRLRSLASELSLAEERERRRLAADLHDSVGQTLALCKLRVDALRAQRPDLALDEIAQMVEQVVGETRSLMFQISPPVLHELGLEPALEWLAEEFQRRQGSPVVFHDDGLPKPLSDSLRILLFQSARELLLNAAKHAQSERIFLSIRRNGGAVSVEVRDEGVGFEPEATLERANGLRRFGIFSIRERLQYAGGSVAIASRPGCGAAITLTVPLSQDPTQETS